MAELISIEALDPDYRREPKTDCYCRLCQRDIKDRSKAKWVHEVEGGGWICHVEDDPKYDGTPGDLLWFPVGPECAKKVPVGYLSSDGGKL